MNNLLEAARRYHAAGLNVLPADRKQKRPKGAWKQWTKERPDFDAVFPAGLKFDALCVVCGPTSGNLEIIDFDQKATAFDGWAKQLPADLVNSLPTETTQSGGRHVAYRCETVERNQKLARNADGTTTIETRGTGGICLINPTDGYSSIWGDWESIPTITPEQRARLLDAARACDEPQTEKPKKGPTNATRITNANTQRITAPTFTGESVADFLRSNLDIVRQALTRAGWEYLRVEGDFEQWQRPNQPQAGKLGGSLCTNLQSDGYGCFHCFTSNAAPLEVEGNYSPLQLIAALEFHGDTSAASKVYAPNRRSLPIVELLDPDEVHYSQSLEMNAEGVTYSATTLRDACIQRQRERLERQAEKRAAATLEEIDVETLNDSFPLGVLPAPVRGVVTTLGDRHGTPYASIAAVGFSVLSGVLGCFKTSCTVDSVPITPLFHTFIVAGQGSGKTKTRQAFTKALEPLKQVIAEKKEKMAARAGILRSKMKTFEKRISNGETLTEKEEKELEHIDYQLSLIEWGERYEMPAKSSVQALWYQSAMNERAAKLEGKKQHGILFTLSDARTLVRTDTQKADDAAGDFWEKFLDVLGFCEEPTPAVGEKARPIKKGGAAWIIDVQPHYCSFVSKGDTGAGGFPRRFVWVCLPSRDDKITDEVDLDQVQKCLTGLCYALSAWEGGDLKCGYRDAWKEWANPKIEEHNKIRLSDPVRAAYLKTVYSEYVHSLALLLHVCYHVESGAVPETIDAETFKNAAQLFDAFLKSRDLTWNVMKNAVESSKKRKNQDAPKGLDELSPQARKTYGVVCEIMRKEGRGATITEINGKVRAYRRKMDRKAIDAELLDAGLMYIDPETTERGNAIASGERVAVPVYNLDPFSGDLVEATADEATADEEPTTNSPFWK